MNNITPPQISEERIAQLWDAIPKSWPPTRANRAVFAQAVADEINRQWLERLEIHAWALTGGCEVFLASEFTPDLEGNQNGEWTPLYRIKEQG